ncbi:hypothetical protein OFY17_08885 [Marinomonas sp. C2222]|uniref:DUF2786 domain-containing protein n=1 Tax=Marinomonas sargassi TaxID=2984494 RepID=A0ABT2YTQ4_9GAMM|nr:hypothetical protein [Marinomonas sargassi]MCV2402989.1 hypothetical protein [Marinomonas sargassi]
MSIRRRKKAIQKVVKLLNLATSSNSSESTMALRHAESLIRLYEIAQRELPILQLCDRSMLYKVSWGGASPKFTKESKSESSSQQPVYQRRFSEKAYDPSRAYESAPTILDDMDLSGSYGSDDSLNSTSQDAASEQSDAAPESLNDELVGDASYQESATNEKLVVEDESLTESDVEPETVSANDNVIDASDVFRFEPGAYADRLKKQGSNSDPSAPFADNVYWQKVYEELADYDELKAQTDIENLTFQLSLAEENLQLKKQKRHELELMETQERAKRAEIERSFEEAMERAFKARAKSYEAWEESCSKIRVSSMKDEQEAAHGFDQLSQQLVENKLAYESHLKRKEDYQAAKVMHDLRGHLISAVSVGDEAAASYSKVIEIMEENALSLKDLEFSDIKNKSLFIRLLERESALIEDVQKREFFTEEMLDKFLSSSVAQKSTQPTESPLERIQGLLVAASEGGQFEAQKNLEQVMYLMDSNGLSVRDVGFGYVKKYSVFIRLINWEAEKITSLTEREKFTADILEEYIQHSVQKPKTERKQKVS